MLTLRRFISESIENDRQVLHEIWRAMKQKINTPKDVLSRGVFKNGLLVGYNLDGIHPMLDNVDAMFQWEGLGTDGPGIDQFLHVGKDDGEPKTRYQIFAGPSIDQYEDSPDIYDAVDTDLSKDDIQRANSFMANAVIEMLTGDRPYQVVTHDIFHLLHAKRMQPNILWKMSSTSEVERYADMGTVVAKAEDDIDELGLEQWLEKYPTATAFSNDFYSIAARGNPHLPKQKYMKMLGRIWNDMRSK